MHYANISIAAYTQEKKEEGYGCNTKPNSPKPVWLHTQNIFYIQNIQIEHTA